VARDIARVSVTSPELASGALAATALAVAAQIDNPKNSALEVDAGSRFGGCTRPPIHPHAGGASR